MKFSMNFINSELRIRIYEKKIHVKTNTRFMIVENNDECAEQHDRLHNKFFSFHNFVDSTLTLWFQKIDCIKIDVINFFQNEKLQFMRNEFTHVNCFHEDFNFKNGEKWLSQLNKISMNVRDNRWTEQKLIVNFEMKKNALSIINIQYKNVNQFIFFFMKHTSFVFDLIYASVRQYNKNDERVYTEMKTKNWWWKKQQQLSKNVIIISLLVVTDKIVMTQHHDDVIAWPVYMIIDNLKIKARWNQNRSSSLFLEFISIACIFDQKNIKAKIWHQTLTFMLKRMSFFVLIIIINWFFYSHHKLRE